MGWLDKLKNKRDETQGAAKEHAGKATGDKKMEREGKTGPDQEQPQAGRREGQGRLRQVKTGG